LNSRRGRLMSAAKSFVSQGNVQLLQEAEVHLAVFSN
jgi:hypothetical protein